ncbi:hypothetical protein QNM99_07825 [Pseudomonas sp. PCH446]
MQNQTITLNPDLYYGKRLYHVLEMDLPELRVPGNNEAVYLGSAASRPYDTTVLLFNAEREADLDRHPSDTLVNYEITLTRYDGQPTLPTSGYLSFAEIKKAKSKGFVLRSSAPASAFNLSALQFSYRITRRSGARIEAFEDDKKDFLQVKVTASSHQLVDMQAINKAHALDFLYLKFPLDGKGVFKYLNIPFPRFRVLYDSAMEVTYNSLQRIDLSSALEKNQHELLIDMTSLAPVAYLDKRSFLRAKGLTYFETAPTSTLVNISYEILDANYQVVANEKYIGRCHFRAVSEDVNSRRLFNLAAQGKAYFFEIDIKDPLKENGSASYYRLDLSSLLPFVAVDQLFFSEVDFYYNQKVTFEKRVKELDLPYEDLDVTPAIADAHLEGFLDDHTLAYTAIPFSFERMAQDVFMVRGFPEAIGKNVSIHGYSKTGRKLFGTKWSEKKTGGG